MIFSFRTFRFQSSGIRRLMFFALAISGVAFGKWLVDGLAQHKAKPAAERRSSAAKTKTKTSPIRKTKNDQQQINADGSITGSLWVGETGIAETTADIMEREAALRANGIRSIRQAEKDSGRNAEREHERLDRDGLPQNPEALPGMSWPPLETAGMRDKEKEEQNLHLSVPPSLRHSVSPSPSRQLAPSPTLSFTAANLAETSAFPPDAMGAVGPTQFLLAVNGRIRVFNKTTGAIGQLDADIDSFFNSVRAGSITTDPRVRYDRLSGRWFIVLINAASTNNRVLLAVSDSATINTATTWTFYQFQHNQVSPAGDNGCFADFPTLGIDANALYVGLNQFCNRAFSNTTAFVIRKSSLLSGGQIVVSVFRNLVDMSGSLLRNGIFTPQGVDNSDPNSSEGYFIGTDANSLGRLVLRRVTNPGGVPVMSANIYLNVLATSQPITVRHRGNINGVNGRLDAIDDRLTMAQFRQGSIWTTHNISVNNEGTVDAPRTRNGIRWYEITDVNTNSPTLKQAGTLFTPTASNAEDERNYFMPSLAISGQGHVLLGGNTAGTNEYINAMIANRLAGDSLGTLQSPLLISSSPAPYNPSSDSGNQQGRRRWGDYSFTSVDPCDDMTLWTVQQFADVANSYGLRVAKIPAPPPAIPAAANPPAVAAGQSSVNVTITGISAEGAGFFDPGAAFSCRLRAQVSDGVTVNSVSYVNPTTVQLNLSTVAAGAGIKTVTITNPDGQSATGNNILTVGNCAYSVVANNTAFAASGGAGTINVETSAACGWTAISNSSFITINSGSVASGAGTVNFTVAPTIGAARTGTITVAGQTVTISQNFGNGCAYALTPATRNFPANGGSGNFTVTAASECEWTPTISDSFIKVLFVSGTQGNGSVNFTVAANEQPIPRTGTISIGGQAFTITQDAAPFELSVDDGGFETAAGISTGGTSFRVNRLTPAFYPATINAVSVYFPDNASVRVGDQFSVVVAANSDGDANIDGMTFQTTAAQVQQVGAFNVINIAPLTISSGDFVVGIRLTQAENVFPFALDTTKSKTRSYRSLDGVTFELIDSIGSFGNYGIRARLVRPAKLLIATGASLVTESCAPANKVIDPGETVTVSLSLGNNGSSSITNLTATLLSAGNITIGDQIRTYGAMTPGSAAVTRQFTFTASGACGGTLPVILGLKDGNEDLGVVTFNFTMGALGTTARTFSYAGEATKIPDGDSRGVSLPIVVSGFGSALADLNFRIDGTECSTNLAATGVGVDHSWVGDLVFRLTSPAGTTVTIISRPGGSGNSGKNFCQTLLDDDAADAMSIGSIASNGPTPQGPPYTGTFKPSNALSAFDGENPNGTWLLTVVDAFAGDSGSVRAFSLQLTGFACCQTNCLDVSGLSASSGFAGNQITISGTGFSGVTSVKFGDVAAQFTINNNNSITATVPAGARTAPIVLGKPGCVDAQTLTFTAFPSIALTPAALSVSIGGVSNLMTVSLGYAQSNGVTVSLSSSNTSFATVPASIVVPAGSTSTSFSVTGVATGNSVTITATLPVSLGGTSASATVNRVGQGYEADVSPRPSGNNNGVLTVSDWVQVGRFVAGLDTIAAGNEFQRADVAPRETLGDGRITLIDWVQTGRYVAGVDALPVAGGPASVTLGVGSRESGVGSRELGVGKKSANEFAIRNADGLVMVKLDATGEENALGFSLNFDSSAWRFVLAKVGRNAQSATLLVNSSEAAKGRVGVALALPTGQTLRAGNAEIVTLQFAPVGPSRKLLRAELSDFPIARSLVNAKADQLR
ncbi:MAG: proprotein convertase P-domain-containing protein [Acidobacteriota bacterium]|nr:proprotein convertase P-domain-containing protein [Acidobacteriota bacterium]